MGQILQVNDLHVYYGSIHAVKGVSFDDLTLADWQAAQLGQIEAPFTAEDYTVMDS
mgnify:CR=1 FL=1